MSYIDSEGNDFEHGLWKKNFAKPYIGGIADLCPPEIMTKKCWPVFQSFRGNDEQR